MQRPFHILAEWQKKPKFNAEFTLVNHAILMLASTGKAQDLTHFSPEAQQYYWGVTGSAGLPACSIYRKDGEVLVRCPHCNFEMEPTSLEEFAEKLVYRQVSEIRSDDLGTEGGIDIDGHYDACDDEEDSRFECKQCAKEFVAPDNFELDYI